MSIEEANKMIAEFEGRTWKSSWFLYPNIFPYFYTKGRMERNWVNKSKRVCIPDLQYHSSWDWLIPVVEIIGLHEKRMCGIALSMFYEGDIHEVWLHTVAFIEWLNKETKVQGSDTTMLNQGTKS